MPSILPERPSVPQLKARIFKASNGCGSGFVAAGVMARGATQKQALLQCCFGPAPRLVSSKPVSPQQQPTTTKSGSCYTLPRQHYHYPFPSSLSRNLSHFEFQHPLMAPCRTLVVPWCVGMFLRLRIGLGVRRTWRKLEKTCSALKLQCRKGDTIQDLWELEFFISCAFLGIRIPSSMWEQRCGNRQGSKAAVYSRYNKN